MTQDHYRLSIPFSEIIREAGEVRGDLAKASVTAEGEDMQKIIEKSIEAGVRLCGFEIGYDNSTNTANDSTDLLNIFSPEAQLEINRMVEREEI